MVEHLSIAAVLFWHPHDAHERLVEFPDNGDIVTEAQLK